MNNYTKVRCFYNVLFYQTTRYAQFVCMRLWKAYKNRQLNMFLTCGIVINSTNPLKSIDYMSTRKDLAAK